MGFARQSQLQRWVCEGGSQGLGSSSPYFWKWVGFQVGCGRAGRAQATCSVPVHLARNTGACWEQEATWSQVDPAPQQSPQALGSSSCWGRPGALLGQVLVDSGPGSPFRQASTTIHTVAREMNGHPGLFSALSLTPHLQPRACITQNLGVQLCRPPRRQPGSPPLF